MVLPAVGVKWAKSKFEVELDPACATETFKALLHELTGVPPSRMKLMAKGTIVKDEPDWSKYKLKEGITLMMMGAADPGFTPAGGTATPAIPRPVAGVAAARELLEEAAAASAAEAEANASKQTAAAASTADDEAALGRPLCRVTVKHGPVEYSLSLRGLREGQDSAASFEELVVADVMQHLFAASGVPMDQQKLVHKGTVLAGTMALGRDRAIKPGKDGVPAAKMVLMGTDKYHRVQAEGRMLSATEQEVATLEADCGSAVSAASHRADRAVIQVRVSRMLDVACGIRSRLQAVHWRGDGMEDEQARQGLLSRLSNIEVQLETVRRQI
eukprot:COSAG02_NODE_268_length_26526_cov_28.495554_10_plen_329_part_00